MRKLRSAGGDRGASIIEFAVLTPVMVLVVMGVLDLSRAYRMQIQLENAAREGAALAQLRPNDVDCGGDDIIRRVLAEESGVGSLPEFAVEVWAEDAGGELTVPVTGCGGTAVESGERVRVDVVADFDVLTPMVERVVGEEIRITGSAEVRFQG